MRTKYWTRHLAWGVLGLVSQQAFSQVTQTNNNGGAGSFLGWNAAANQILDVKNDGNQPIDFYTNATFRERINPRVTYPLLNTFANIPADGFTLLSPDNGFLTQGPRGPFSRLHLAEGGTTNNAQQFGYRPWQRNGITFTGNSDQGYIGHKYGALDYSDMVIQWSDNPGFWKGDRLRFIFTSAYNSSAATGMNSLEGLEGMRLFPTVSDGINTGIGDFYAAGGDPTERLDVLDGRVRIRQLPDDPAAQEPYKVMVVDDSPMGNPERGVVKWVDPSVFAGGGGGADCDWVVDATARTVTTAWQPSGTNGSCPDERWLTGIGRQAITSKLEVAHDETTSGEVSAGITVDVTANQDNWIHGVWSRVHPGATPPSSGTAGFFKYENPTYEGDGIVAKAIVDRPEVDAHWIFGLQAQGWVDRGNVDQSYGAQGWSMVSGGGHADISYGLVGTSYVFQNNPGTIGTSYGLWANGEGGSTSNYGVWATASGNNAWAGHFAGHVSATAYHVPSDANLKTILASEDSEEVSDVLLALPVHKFLYRTDAFPQMHLPEGEQVGLMAQEVEDLLPQLVKQAMHPVQRDEEGNVTAEAVNFKAVNYVGLIPYLIAGYQAQQGKMDALRAEMQELRDRLADCCARPGADQRLLQGGSTEGKESDSTTDRLLRIAPNPFTDRTTLYCTLERAGRMQLVANSADGRELRVLAEGQREAGAFQYEWSTADLAPGVYYVTLLLDGQPVVKRAVKVGR
jgi:hypothetical protein